uniref:Uncharacterized protein n=1 Tax=Panagrolaimus sp. PS1159 TaxID=55785 RepID=A0AC35G1S1_9BILA
MIKKHEPVDQKRKDYKTLRCGIPSSDFDKASKIPKERATQKGGAFDRASEVETAFGFGKVEKKKEGS